jgi:hypothetical protein
MCFCRTKYECDVIHYLGVVHLFLLKIETKSAFFVFYFKHRTTDKVKLSNNSNCNTSYKINENVDCVA